MDLHGRKMSELIRQAFIDGYERGSTGEKDIVSFVTSCGSDYLIKKFAPHVPLEIPITDEIQLEKEMKKEIITRRLNGDIKKDIARKIWNEIESSHCSVENTDLMYLVFGDDWWEYIPSEPNPKYQYLEKVIQTVKDGLKMYAEEKKEDVLC